MTDMNNPQQSYSNMPPVALPNATAVLIMGILSILSCCCYGIVGVILGIIALVLAKKDMKLYYAAPESYTRGSYKNLNAGRICAIIGLILSALYLVFAVIIIMTVGLDALQDPEALREAVEGMQQI